MATAVMLLQAAHRAYTHPMAVAVRYMATGVDAYAADARSSTAATTGADTAAPSSINAAEVAKFSSKSDQWWKPTGEFAALRAMNPARGRFLMASAHACGITSSRARLGGASVLDMGCGGGLFAEHLCRLGGHVLGVDASPENIAAATAHAATARHADHAGGSLSYRAATAEALVAEGLRFDLVVASEVVEHVDHQAQFIRDCASLVKPSGGLFVSTMNRTAEAMALAVVVAEQVARVVPAGTHQHEKFVEPEELEEWLASAGPGGFTVRHRSGLAYNPVLQTWSPITSERVNYTIFATGGH